jgi:hypothetical protein
MLKISELKRRRKNAFMKEAATLSAEYTRKLEYHINSNFTKYANECFKLVKKYTEEDKW